MNHESILFSGCRAVPRPALREMLEPVPAGVEVVEWTLQTPAPAARIDIVVAPYMGRAKRLARLAKVETWLVQGQSIGYDGVAEALPPGHRYANAAGVHETSTAELNLALILASQRGLPGFARAAGQVFWPPTMHPSLADRTVLLIGYGGVGKATEERLLPFETKVIRMASRARTDHHGVIHGIESLSEFLPQADIVVVCVPLTAATTQLVDQHFLSLMRDNALLVNTARGGVADTEAILDHASRGRLRFALDVTEPEPLPEDHPLFSLPNVLITPHVGGNSTAMMPRMGRLLRQQIERLQRGQEPLNVVINWPPAR